MKIVYCATRWPIPITGGRQTMILQVLNFCQQLGETHIAYFGQEDAHLHLPLSWTPASACWLDGGNALSAIGSLVRSPLAPLQSHLLSSRSAQRKFESYIEAVDPDVIIFDMLRTIHLAKVIRAGGRRRTSILDMDDLLSLRYSRMLANKNFNITGTFTDRIPSALKMFVNFGPAVMLRLEAFLMGRLERRIPRYFDAAFAVSAKEAQVVKRSLASGFPIKAIPPAVSGGVASSRDSNSTLRFVFVGDALQFANSEALRELDRIAMEVFERLGDGDRPIFEAAGRANPDLKFEAINFRGFVDDLDAFLGGGAVLVAPISTGTGIKIKVLDAMSRAIPVITTAQGVEGLDVEPGRDFIICDRHQSLADTLIKIVTGQITRQELARIGDSGARVIRENHSHDKLFLEFERLVKSAKELTI